MPFELPESWLSQLHPRRGGAGVRAVVPDPRAREVVDGQMRELPDFVPGVLAGALTDPELGAAGRAWLDQDPAASPVGAAVVALATQPLDWAEHQRRPWFADLWLGERGLRFAVVAAVELHCLARVTEGDRPLSRGISRDHPETVGVRRSRFGERRDSPAFYDPDHSVLLRVRAALAAAPDDVHAEIAETLAGYREFGLNARCATSVLVPSRADWVAQDWADSQTEPTFRRAFLLLNAIGTAEQAASVPAPVRRLGPGWPGLAATVADGVGPAAAAGLLLDWFDLVAESFADTRQDVLRFLAVLPEDAAMRGLITRADQRHVRPALADAAGRFPERALRLLSAEAGRPGVSDLLRVRVRADPALAERVAAGLPPASAARVRELLAESEATVPAPPEALPPLLADPPWRRRAKPSVVGGLRSPEIPVAVQWAPGEREEWLAVRFDLLGAGDWAGVADRLRRGEPMDWREPVEFFLAAPQEVARPLLAGWRPERAPDCGCWMRRIAARFEVATLPALKHLAARAPMEVGVLLLPFTDPDLPWRVVSGLFRSKEEAPAARAWLERNPAVAAEYFVPRAVGPVNTARQMAEFALVTLIAAGHVDTVRGVAGSYGPDAAAAVELLVGKDLPAILPAKLPSLPKWLDPAVLPPVRLRRPSTFPPPATPAPAPAPAAILASGGGPAFVLPTGVLRDLAMVFALHRPPIDPYHPGVEIVREACEPADLTRFVWALFESWEAAGAGGRHGWVMDALALFGDDETVRRLTPRIMKWPGQSGHARALTGLGVLVEIGTEVALLHLHHIAERSRFTGLRSAAQQRIGRLAEKLGLTAEQLADRLVPDFGLDDDGSLTLDYGSRSFAVRFDEELKPCVVDTNGKLLKNLPRPGARDDAERASAACQRFAVLKKDVRTAAADQIRRLERAMRTGRRWPEDEFRRFFAGHPLLRHLTRRLLWGRYDAKDVLTGGFRVAEDGTFADVHDQVATIAGDEVIGVAHPIHLGETLPLWSEVFADYRILQPFRQLGRETATLTEAEAAGVVLTRFQGRRVPSGAVLGLESRGWVRGTMRDSRTLNSVAPSLAHGLDLELDPGIVLGAVHLFPEQTLGPVRLYSRVATFGDLDPVAVSEMIRDLELLTGGR